MKPLGREFYYRSTPLVATDLLGKVLICGCGDALTSGRIVETEAYLGPGDPASHAHKGETRRSSVMFGPPGHAYVYFTYGMHHLFNVVTEPEGVAGAVLIRSIEPMSGIDLMMRRRGGIGERDLTNGPAKLTQALGIDLKNNHQDLTVGSLFIVSDGGGEPRDVVQAPRVGISKGKEALLRFYVRSSPFVSKG